MELSDITGTRPQPIYADINRRTLVYNKVTSSEWFSASKIRDSKSMLPIPNKCYIIRFGKEGMIDTEIFNYPEVGTSSPEIPKMEFLAKQRSSAAGDDRLYLYVKVNGKDTEVAEWGEDEPEARMSYVIDNSAEGTDCRNIATMYSPGCVTAYCAQYQDGVIQVVKEEKCRYSEDVKSVVKVIKID